MSTSIIIPVYNVSSYLQEAVDSVLKQISVNDEVIIVDDGSTDTSGQLVDELYSNNPQVKILHTKNNGLGGARNNGLKVATKEFIYYFDSDDVLCNSLFDAFNKALAVEPCLDLFVFSAKSFQDKETDSTLPDYNRNIDGLFESGEDAFSYLYSVDRCYPNAWLYITRKSVIDSAQLTFKSIIHEDEEYTPRLFKVCGKTYVTKNVYFYRRVRQNSIMQSRYSEKNVLGYMESIRSQYSLMQSSQGVFKKMIKKRIINNISIIFNIISSKGFKLTASANHELSNILKNNPYFSVYLIRKSRFLYRIFRFIEIRLRKRLKVPFVEKRLF